MSASMEYMQEKEALDRYLRDGYEIVRIREDLDGAEVTFRSKATGEVEAVQLLTADARKYITTVLFAGM